MRLLKQWLPREVIRIGRHAAGYGQHFRGGFATWEEACAGAEGYGMPEILEQVLQATFAVRDGKAAFEREGVLFAQADDRYPLVAVLMRAAALSKGHLRVIDFGGSLGSAYFQCRPWLRGLASLSWNVVEQPHYVEAGSAQLADDTLKFFTSMEAAAAAGGVDVILFSSVLQYLHAPQDILRQAYALGPRFIMIDRTPVIAGQKDILCLQKQHFPRHLIRYSLPIRLFSRQSLLDIAKRGYVLLSEFEALDEPMGGLVRVDFKGFIFERE